MDEVSYMAGFLYGTGLRTAKIDGIDEQLFAEALAAAYDPEREDKYSMEELKARFIPYVKVIAERMRTEHLQEKQK